MSVKFEIRGMLAKLLATEDIIVEHKNVDTACFNVHTRCLTLPIWEKASDNIYTMLVLHEISHSLWSPDIDWSKEHKVPQQFVNIVEDVRVEKLCKRKYPGSPKSFYNGYKELHEQDFFAIGDEDVSTYNLADRVNLYFKIGNFLSLSFTEKEWEIVDMIGDAETFGDALIAAEVLYKYCKEQEQEQMKLPELDIHNQSPGQSDKNDNSSENSQEKIESDDEQSDDGKSDDENQTPEGKKDDETPVGPQGGKEAEPEVKTMSSFEDAIKQLASNPSLQETVYLEIPKVNLDSAIVSNERIHKECSEYWGAHSMTSDFEGVDKEYNEFKRSAQKEVNYLVKEFECRKSADSYARATTSRTGVLDTTKLHTYKYNEDLFKKVTTLADGKNHGLVFVLDWSGSMGNVMTDTVKQLYNLIWFCRKVSIPFEVYAFTNSFGPTIEYGDNNLPLPPKEHIAKKDNVFAIDYTFNMMNILTSKVRNVELDKQMKNIFRIATYFGKGYYNNSYPIPARLHLSGTPLNEALVTLHQILPKFQSENKLQKVQCVILTDGEAGPLNYYRTYKRDWESKERLGTAYVSEKCFLRDRKTGNVYSMMGHYKNPYSGFTTILIQNLRDKFADVNFIGMRILDGSAAGHFIREHTSHSGGGKECVEANERWKKERSFVLTSAGYHKYFGISGSALNKSTQFQVEEDASKAKIKSAFVKSLGAKKMNKKILNEFIELVA
jgi:hypothetical protein